MDKDQLDYLLYLYREALAADELAAYAVASEDEPNQSWIKFKQEYMAMTGSPYEGF